MSLLTGGGMDKILRRIMEKGELNDELANDVQRIRDDFNERSNYLSMVGEVYNGEDKDEYDFSPNASTNVYTPDEEKKLAENWENKYNEIKKQYLDRFFGGNPEGTDVGEIMKETVSDVQRDGEPQTFDELLERTEG